MKLKEVSLLLENTLMSINPLKYNNISSELCVNPTKFMEECFEYLKYNSNLSIEELNRIHDTYMNRGESLDVKKLELINVELQKLIDK